MMKRERRRKRTESAGGVGTRGLAWCCAYVCLRMVGGWWCEGRDCGIGRVEMGGIGRTEDELLRRRQHVERECDFVLVALALEPAEERGWVEHCDEEQGGGGGEEDDGGHGGRVEHGLLVGVEGGKIVRWGKKERAEPGGARLGKRARCRRGWRRDEGG